MGITSLRNMMSNCQACRLCQHRTQIVFGEGCTESPKFMIIGEGPGQDEDERGVPFVGRCGEKLDKILEYVGVTRGEIFITNAVLCRPPNNRTPLLEEMQACRFRLMSQISTIRPNFLVILGRAAFVTMLNNDFKGALRPHTGKWLDFLLIDEVGQTKYPMIITYHPSYLLRRGIAGSKEVLPHWNLVKNMIENTQEEIAKNRY